MVRIFTFSGLNAESVTGIRIAVGHSMKPFLVVLALVSLGGLVLALAWTVPARASSNSGVEPVPAQTCVDRYNSLLKGAKGALAAGDRSRTVDLLQQAKNLIPACPALQNGPLSFATSVSL